MILIKAVNTVVYKEAVYIRLSVLFFVAMTIHGGYFSILSVSNIKDPNNKNVDIFVTPSPVVRQIFDKIFSITVIISTRWSNGFFN